MNATTQQQADDLHEAARRSLSQFNAARDKLGKLVQLIPADDTATQEYATARLFELTRLMTDAQRV